MTKPKDREVRVVERILALSRQEVTDLRILLSTLGFDDETIALMWGREVADVQRAFSVTGLSGADLVHFAQELWFRPAIVQRKIHFNETQIGTRKVGFKSTPARRSWQGPPLLCVDGNTGDGSMFHELYQSPGVAGVIHARSHLDHLILQRIKDGKQSVHLQHLRDLAAAVEIAAPEHPKLPKLRALLGSFPPDVRTVEDVFAPATKTSIAPKEVQTMTQHDIDFSAAFTAAEMGVIAKSFMKDMTWPLLERLLINLQWETEDWQTFEADPRVLTYAEMSTVLRSCRDVSFFGEQERRYKHLLTFFNSHPWPEKILVADKSDEGYEGVHGEVWFATRVVCQDCSIDLVGEDINVLSKRVYRSLDVVQSELGLKWPAFCKGVGVSYDIITSMRDGQCKLSSKTCNLLLAALKVVYGVSLTLEELFGLAAMPKIQPSQSEVPMKALDPVSAQYLFSLGDTRTAYMWISVLRKYRTVYKQFTAEYNLHPRHEAEILEGKRRVPLVVHQYLMWLVAKRLAQATDPVLPRSYQRLVEMPESAFSESQFADGVIPKKTWLQSQ